MEIRVPDETTIRDYLLGRLDPHSEIVERMDGLMLTNAEFSENLGVIEDEIIEEYLEGSLAPADRQSVEMHFLQPLERQHKLQSARLLSRHLAATLVTPEGKRNRKRVRPLPDAAAGFYTSRFNFRMYAEIAAALLLAVSIVYLVQQRRDLQTTLRKSSQYLAQERAHSASLDQQLQAARELAQPATVMLNLFRTSLPRGAGGSLPQLKIGPGTKNIHVEVALSSASIGTYNVRLETSGKIVWSLDHVQPFTSPDGAILVFEVPADVLLQGEGRFVLTEKSGAEITYLFAVAQQ
jgi:hypothetical protein